MQVEITTAPPLLDSSKAHYIPSLRGFCYSHASIHTLNLCSYLASMSTQTLDVLSSSHPSSSIVNHQFLTSWLLVKLTLSPVWVSLEQSRYSRPPYVYILVIQAERRGCSSIKSRTFMHYILLFFILSQATTISSCLVLESNHKYTLQCVISECTSEARALSGQSSRFYLMTD